MEAIRAFLAKLSIEQVRQGVIEIQELRAHGVLKSNGTIRSVEDQLDSTIGVGLSSITIAIEAFSNEVFSRFLEMTRRQDQKEEINLEAEVTPGQTG
jgi:hypothetical protein